jgi:hypothetical protein
MMFASMRSAKAGMDAMVNVTETSSEGTVATFGDRVVGFSFVKGEKNIHCYIATQ